VSQLRRIRQDRTWWWRRYFDDWINARKLLRPSKPTFLQPPLLSFTARHRSSET
jgi:hypothetical protein